MHPTLTRTKMALESVENESVKQAITQMIASIEANITSDSKGVPFDSIKTLKDAYGISDTYILFGEGDPLLRTVTEAPQVPGASASSWETEYELFHVRLNMVLNHAGLSLADIAEAIGVSRQSPHGWLKTGQISKGNLAKLCAIEGIDYEWVASGEIRNEEARSTVNALYERARRGVESEMARLSESLALYRQVCKISI